jgi:hypothetical protein
VNIRHKRFYDSFVLEIGLVCCFWTQDSIGIEIADTDSDCDYNQKSVTPWLKSNCKLFTWISELNVFLLKRTRKVFFCCLSNHCLYICLTHYFNWLVQGKEKEYIVFCENVSGYEIFACRNRNRSDHFWNCIKLASIYFFGIKIVHL